MARTWQVQQAKAGLSGLIERARREGPQTVTRHGRPVAVVLAFDAYRRLAGARKDFKAFLRSAPLGDLDLRRDKDRGRRVDL